MKFVETCGRLLNVDDITEISYLDIPGHAEIIIEQKRKLRKDFCKPFKNMNTLRSGTRRLGRGTEKIRSTGAKTKPIMVR